MPPDGDGQEHREADHDDLKLNKLLGAELSDLTATARLLAFDRAQTPDFLYGRVQHFDFDLWHLAIFLQERDVSDQLVAPVF